MNEHRIPTLPYTQPLVFGYLKVASVNGKHYRAITSYCGRLVYTRRAFKRASEATEYGKRLVARYARLAVSR